MTVPSNTDYAAIWDMCLSCARSIYASREPSEEYARRVARMLYGTAAVESAFKYRRQMEFTWSRSAGAWGLWQTESLPLLDSLNYMERRLLLADRAAQWLTGDDEASADFLLELEPPALLFTIGAYDNMACLFARLHYMRKPDPIPDTPREQAEYWKQHYNTPLGKGTVGKYLEAWERYWPMCGGAL